MNLLKETKRTLGLIMLIIKYGTWDVGCSFLWARPSVLSEVSASTPVLLKNVHSACTWKHVLILSCGRKSQVALDSSSGRPCLHSRMLDLGWHQYWHTWTFLAIVTRSTGTLYLFMWDMLVTCLIGGPLVIWIIGVSGNTNTIRTACRWVKLQLYLRASRYSWWLITTFTFL